MVDLEVAKGEAVEVDGALQKVEHYWHLIGQVIRSLYYHKAYCCNNEDPNSKH